ncbi:MAG: alanine dehydrogenase [Natronincolaceae bacterium]|jgi:alanine dehydrogenase|nr:alanine dehydrogenase [Bacillota bacterium]NLK90226.1 alanine dehydrogenase [Clostridiales bacterium]
MIIGTIKERKQHEYRVGITPDNAAAYTAAGHSVYVETGAGDGAGFPDADYVEAGAKILPTMEEVYASIDMMVKVKEPLPEEYKLLRPGLILYAYLHLAADKQQAEALAKSRTSAIAYETMVDNGGLPCLRPMSEIAGRLSIQEGAKYIESSYGGRGILLGGVPGVERGEVVIVGGGIAGTYAAKASIGMGAQVTVLDINLARLQYLDDIFGTGVTTLYASERNIRRAVSKADLVVGTVLVPGNVTPKVIRREHLKFMKSGAVIVDVSIDQGGCCETSKITFHDDPVFIEEGVVHYCVGNMPGAVPRTSTVALTNATLAYGLQIANLGFKEAAKKNKVIATGVNYYNGMCTNMNVAKSLNVEYRDLMSLI